jgi:hypothetical protein
LRGSEDAANARPIRGYVALAHPATIIGNFSILAHALIIDLLRDRSTSCAPAAPTDPLTLHSAQQILRKCVPRSLIHRLFIIVQSVPIKKRLLAEPLYHHKYMFLGLKSPAKSYLKVSSKLVSNPIVVLLLLKGD